jgi:pimeloyl-ACP methyl ester carboxylesterase
LRGAARDGARLALFERSSHAPFWEEPEEFNRTLEEFLNQMG